MPVYTTCLFEAHDHRPEPFLGQRASLPELAQYSDKVRSALENPVLSMDQADAFIDAMVWFINGYDQKLSREHWGVITARTLETLFWRMVDMTEKTPRWNSHVGHDVSMLRLHAEGLHIRNLARDLTLSIKCPPGTDPDNDDWISPKYPPNEREHLLDQDAGNERVQLFWKPLPTALIVQALAAWDALRFCDAKDAHGKPRRFFLDVNQLRKEGPLVTMGALFGSSFAAGVQACLLDANSVAAQGALRPNGRL